MKTTCEVCLFSKKEDSKQVGCEFNRLEFFQKEYVNDHYVLDGYCNNCRNINWDFYQQNNNSSIDILKNQVKLEEEASFEFIIDYEDYDILVEKIEKILNSGLRVTTCEVLTNKLDFQVIYNNLINKFGSDKIKVKFSFDDKTEEQRFISALKVPQKISSLYTVCMSYNAELDFKFLTDLKENWKDMKYINLYPEDTYCVFLATHRPKILEKIIQNAC